MYTGTYICVPILLVMHCSQFQYFISCLQAQVLLCKSFSHKDVALFFVVVVTKQKKKSVRGFLLHVVTDDVTADNCDNIITVWRRYRTVTSKMPGKLKLIG